MDPWRLKALAEFQGERVEALLREMRVRQVLGERRAGEQGRKTGFKRTLVVLMIGAVLAALWLAQVS